MIDEKLPQFAMKGIDKECKVIDISNEHIRGKYAVFVFYPLAFTYVCPTELKELGNITEKLEALGSVVISVSTDSHYVQLQWRSNDPVIRKTTFIMASDLNRRFSRSLGMLTPNNEICRRGVIVVNPDGEIMASLVYPDRVGRNFDEIHRIVAAAKTGELCPANWKEGDPFIKI